MYFWASGGSAGGVLWKEVGEPPCGPCPAPCCLPPTKGGPLGTPQGEEGPRLPRMRTAEAFLFLWQPGRLQAEVVEGRGLGPGYSRVLTHLAPPPSGRTGLGIRAAGCVWTWPRPVCPLRERPGWSLTAGGGCWCGKGRPPAASGSLDSPWGLQSLLGTK